MTTDLPQAMRRPDRKAGSWRQILLATMESLTTDLVSMAAAGGAFYATMALFPAISTLISLYGLLFNRASVASQLQFLRGFVPPPTYALIAARVQDLLSQPPGKLGIGLAVAFTITFWSASAGTRSVLSALNVAYGVTEQRSFIRFNAIALAMTLATMLVAVGGIAVVVGLPVVIGFLGLALYATTVVHLLAVLMLLGFVAAVVATLYRLGPSYDAAGRRRLLPGVALATGLWLAASAALSFYVSSLPSFGATYGSLGAVVGVMLWFYLSVYAVLVGAELNAILDARSTQTGAAPAAGAVTSSGTIGKS